MAKKKISGLPAGSALNGTELVPIVQAGTTKRTTTQDIADLGNASSVSGSGTINYLAKFTASSTLGNSLLQEGTNVIGLTTPNVWGGNARALQISDASIWGISSLNGYASIGGNYYYDGSYKYIKTNKATDYFQYEGEHVWRNAPSGTAGSVFSFNTKMTLDASGNLGLGTATPSAMLTLNATTPYIRIERTGVPTWQIQNNTLVAAAGFSINNITNATTPFFINGTNDYVGIGTAAPATALEVFKSSGSAVIRANYNNTTTFDLTASSGGNVFLSTGANAMIFENTAETMRLTATNNVLINTSTDVASSKLTINSTTQGVLVPRMTTTQINAIVTPANGLIAYNTTLAVLCFYDGSGWKKVSHSAM